MDTSRVHYPPMYCENAQRAFAEVTHRALEEARRSEPDFEHGVQRDVTDKMRSLLALLDDPEITKHSQKHAGSEHGATYKSISYVGRSSGMGDDEREEWIGVCEELGLSQKHIGHIIARLQSAG